jgi:hypothetical protein
VYSRITKKQTLYTKKSVKGLTARSLLPQIAALWNNFSVEEKQAWNDAANVEKDLVNLPVVAFGSTFFGVSTYGDSYFGIHITESIINGWRLFVQDQSVRIKNEFAGVAVPVLLHQSWVGNLKIEAPATELKIVQLHPRFYWISRKITGKKGMYEPTAITEDLALPVKISLNYSSNLVETSPGSFAKFYARVWHSYQGVDLYEDLEILFDYFSDWQYVEATLTSLIGYVIRYDLYFHLYNLQGDLYFDNVKIEHSSQNWIRDPFCKDINQGFTRAFYQIPKNWAAVIIPDGAMLDSIYKDF